MSSKNYYIRLSWTEAETGRKRERSELPPISFGRRNSNTIVLEGHRVSREHARLDIIDGKSVLTDLNSVNGIFVDGQRVTRAILQAGSEFQIGTYTFTYHLDTDRRLQDRHSSGPSVQCANPECRRIVSTRHFDCPWCGYALNTGKTVYRDQG